MDQTEERSLSDSDSSQPRSVSNRGRRAARTAGSSLRWGFESGVLPAVLGGFGLRSGLKALREGDRGRSLAWFTFGSVCLAAALDVWQTRGEDSGVEVSDVADRGPDIEAVAPEKSGSTDVSHATGEEASGVVDTAPDIEDADIEGESASDLGAPSDSVDQRDVADTGVDSEDLAETTEGNTAAVGSDAIERLGEAALDRQSRQVPAPQRAFNRGFLAHSTEAFWGVRDDDGAVLVSQDYDAVVGREGVNYVGSTEIGDDVRDLTIPNAVLDHWDEVYGGGTAVTGGDDILFVTTDTLAPDGVLWVLPSDWAADVLGDEE